MPNFAWAILLKPLIALVILVPIRMLVVVLERRMKDGKLKRLLLRRIS
jgi:signal transduction histidine kinase